MYHKRASILKHVIFLSIVLLFSTLFTHMTLLSSLKNSHISAIEAAVRENIILDNRREVIALLNQAKSFGFITIVLTHQNYDGTTLFGKKEQSWFHIAIERKLFFDSNQTFESSRLVFYYSPFEGIWISIAFWLGVSLFSIAPIAIYVDKKSKAASKEEEFNRNRAALEIFNYLAHDMRAPIGVFELLLSVDPSTHIEHHRTAISTAISRLYAMVESIRYSETDIIVKPDICSIDFEFGAISLKEKARIRKIGLSLKVGEVKNVFVDKMKFERAWINLASNAIDFARSRVWIEMEVCSHDLILRVSDDGPGVPEDFLPKLFQRGATHGKADGTGLGLAYVRQIMRGHGGDVSYRREDEKTIFECRIPNAIEPEKEETLNNIQKLDVKMDQKLLRAVAICLDPKALSKSVLSRISSFESNDFSFSEEREGAHIVVSNIDDVMFDVLEGTLQEFVHVSPAWGDEDGIIERLKIKFNLTRG